MTWRKAARWPCQIALEAVGTHAHTDRLDLRAQLSDLAEGFFVLGVSHLRLRERQVRTSPYFKKGI